MTRRQAAGLLLAAALVCGGRLIRHALLVDGAGAWRDPLWLDSLLPPLPDAAPAAAPAAGGLSPQAAALAPGEPEAGSSGEPGEAAARDGGCGAPAAGGLDPGDDGAGAAAATASGGAGRLDVNTAPAESLAALPGIGPVLAARIVADRAAHGPFAGPADLQRVRGIGPRLASRLAPRLRFAPPPRPAAPSGAPSGP